MSHKAQEPNVEPKPPSQSPRPVVMVFAAAFVVAMCFNIATDRSDTVTIFLGLAALVTLGIDVGKITGRH